MALIFLDETFEREIETYQQLVSKLNFQNAFWRVVRRTYNLSFTWNERAVDNPVTLTAYGHETSD
jgi:hypothetical protein